MIRIEPITTANSHLFRQVRLRALQDSAAFGSTYAREASFEDAEWALRVQRWSGEQGVGFLAIDDGQPCGIAGALLEEPGRAQLISMWTAPEYRQRGAGRLLVQAITDWAVSRGVQLLTLMVTVPNDPAQRFYERVGFARTGRTKPWPNDPAIFEWGDGPPSRLSYIRPFERRDLVVSGRPHSVWLGEAGEAKHLQMKL